MSSYNILTSSSVNGSDDFKCLFLKEIGLLGSKRG